MRRGLQLDDDLAAAERDWRAQSAGRACMGLLAAAALAGVLGSGPLSSARLTAPDGSWEASYRRFERRASPVILKFDFRGGASSGPLRLRLSRRYLEDMGFERVLPPPAAVETGAEAVTFVLAVEDPGKPSGAELTLRPKAWGRMRTRVGLTGGPEAELSQLVYP